MVREVLEAVMAAMEAQGVARASSHPAVLEGVEGSAAARADMADLAGWVEARADSVGSAGSAGKVVVQEDWAGWEGMEGAPAGLAGLVGLVGLADSEVCSAGRVDVVWTMTQRARAKVTAQRRGPSGISRRIRP